ncbi:ChaC-like protein, partial [Lactarius pseudohatsudake]
ASAPGFLKGNVRRFALKSHNHRGTPTSPGRVITLVHQEDWASFSSAMSHSPFIDLAADRTARVAFTIDPAHAAEVRAYLARTQQDGYTLDSERVDVHGAGDVPVCSAECYVRRNDNFSFDAFGSEPLEELADTVWRAVGPSGCNKVCVRALSRALPPLT